MVGWHSGAMASIAASLCFELQVSEFNSELRLLSVWLFFGISGGCVLCLHRFLLASMLGVCATVHRCT